MYLEVIQGRTNGERGRKAKREQHSATVHRTQRGLTLEQFCVNQEAGCVDSAQCGRLPVARRRFLEIHHREPEPH